ncbi:MAG: alkaline phosphatase family protein [Erysipelotrichales bacterium]|nr:alkaline phosphatase family protein [Erysipelotrichales bacterium]
MKCVSPDYHAGLLNFMASVKNYFGLDNEYDTLAEADRFLAEKPDNVFVLLIDAMGSKILEKHLPADSFLRSHTVRNITTVYPSTTAAATTIFLTGMAPVSSGWMGWMEYFKEVDDFRILFLNRGYYTWHPYDDHLIEKTIVSQRHLPSQFADAGKEMRIINPKFDPAGVKSIEEMTERILTYANTFHNTYTYAYWDEFDMLLHEAGTDAPEVTEDLRRIDKAVSRLAERLPAGNLLFVIADHGQINVHTEDLTDHPDLMDTMIRKTALEARCTVFYIKPGCEELFERLFRKYYGDAFELMRSRDFLKKYMGPFKPHKRVSDFLGTHVAAARSNVSLACGNERNLIGDHAGLTEDEMMVPLIVYRKEGDKI